MNTNINMYEQGFKSPLKQPKFAHILQIEAKEWFDRINGNSYFAAKAYLDDKLVAVLPFEYGHGDHYIDQINGALDKAGIINNPRHENGFRNSLWRYCEENNIKLITHKQEKCLKREVVAFGGA